MTKPVAKKTLIGVLGASAAMMVMQAVPMEESGRKVAVAPSADGHVQVRHLSGRQYLDAYLDVIGVATACDGLTRNPDGSPIRPGQRFTEAQCSAMLEDELVDSATRVMACTPGLEGHDGPKVASVLLAHNVGWPAFCRSSISRLFNAHAYTAACNRFPLYNKAGGRVLRGLVLRREREKYICLTGKLPYA